MYSSDVPNPEPKRRSFLPSPKTFSKIPAPKSTTSNIVPEVVDTYVPKTRPIAIPQTSPYISQTKPEVKPEKQEFFIGDRVTIGGVKTGTLLYFGTIHLATGPWCGIALDEAEGIHDGLVEDIRYFTCRKGHGIFAPVEKIALIDNNKAKPELQSYKHETPAFTPKPKPSRVSPISSQSNLCRTEPLNVDYSYQHRSSEFFDISEESDEIPGLDDDGIIRDTEEELRALEHKHSRRRKLPKVPKESHNRSRSSYGSSSEYDSVTEDIADDAVEKIKMIDEEDLGSVGRNKIISAVEESGKYSDTELHHSGSSGGAEDWSSKDYLAMCDPDKQYMNITFDGENGESAAVESKPCSRAPSKESPSPEFIFDQEMLEDGEFSSNPMEVSTASSLGILSNLALDRTDLLYDLIDEGDDEEFNRLASPETLKAMSVSSALTPKTQKVLNESVNFTDVTASTPFTKQRLNETFTSEPSSHIDQKVGLNSTYTQDSSQTHAGTANLNSTFTLPENEHCVQSLKMQEEILATKSYHGKGSMFDSGISLRGSMTDSALKGSFTDTGMPTKSAMTDSFTSVKGTVLDSTIAALSARGSMLDSGISSAQTSMTDSGFFTKNTNTNSANSKYVENKSKDIYEKRARVTDVEGKTVDLLDSSLVEEDINKINKGLSDGVGLDKGLTVHQMMDDEKLMSDLQSGHSKKDRPVSFISTTSADTGYVADTDSERGTLTLNSPQEWMEKGFLGNVDQLPEIMEIQRNLIDDFKDKKPVPTSTGSDTNAGTKTEGQDAHGVTSVQPGEATLSGVTMETEESEDELTQVEDTKDLNRTITLDKNNETFTADGEGLDSTFTFADGKPGGDDKTEVAKTETEKTDNNEGSLNVVTIVIEDKNETKTENDIEEAEKEKENEKGDKTKMPKKKKFNVVKNFKKPNTNVTSKLSEYLKAPIPVKPKEDKINTEEAKNKRNSIKGNMCFKSNKIEVKAVEEKVEKKEKEVIVKEPVKKVKRSPPKSKWDTIMSKIDDHKDEKPKATVEIKSKLESFLHIPPPAPPKKEEPPKPKRRLSKAIPDYSRVESKLKYSAPPPKPKEKKEDKTDSPSRRKTDSPNRKKSESPARNETEPRNKSKTANRRASTSSPCLEKKGAQDNNSKPTKSDRSRKRHDSLTLTKNDRSPSRDSVKRHEVRDGMLHIDLADSLDGRSRAGSVSVSASQPGSRTDLSTAGADEEVSSISKARDKRLSSAERLVLRSISQQSEGRDSTTSAISEISNGSQVISKDSDSKASSAKLRRKSSLVQPTNSLGGGAKVVKPVTRQHSAPSKVTFHEPISKHSVFTNQAAPERPASRSPNQNRNKTTKSKNIKPSKPPEPIPADVHTREVQRLEALCESRTKQLNMVKLHLQTSNQAFDGMGVIVNHLAHGLDAFACPGIKEDNKSLHEEITQHKCQISSLEDKHTELEEVIKLLKEKQKEYILKLEAEHEVSLNDQKLALKEECHLEIKKVEESSATEIINLKRGQESHVSRLEHNHAILVQQLHTKLHDEITTLQGKQEHQMEELHKQHQGKLEDITSRFDGIKLTLSEKVESLRQECDRLRDRARLCEDALQRDSDYKVQCALAPYKHLPEEIESIKTVVEMRNDEIQKLRNHNQELRKKLEELPVAQEKIIALQQKKENLEAIISMKTDHERALHGKCQNLMKKYDKESRANKRLSMDYEELMWKLSESFTESDMGAQETLFYKKLGMSPPGTDFLGSPEVSRKLSTPSRSDGNNPSQSTRYRRCLSGGNEDKKLKRRSAAHLVDERKQRSTSPLDREKNPLTKSWSPSTEPASPARSGQQVTKQMSQSWSEADVFESADVISSESESTQSSQRRIPDSGSLSSVSEISSENSQNAAADRVKNVNGISADSDNLKIDDVENSSSECSSGRHVLSLPDDDDEVFRHKKDSKVISPEPNCHQFDLDLSSSMDSMDLDSLRMETPLSETHKLTSPPSAIPKELATISTPNETGSRSPESSVDAQRSRTQAIPTCSKIESAV